MFLNLTYLAQLIISVPLIDLGDDFAHSAAIAGEAGFFWALMNL